MSKSWVPPIRGVGAGARARLEQQPAAGHLVDEVVRWMARKAQVQEVDRPKTMPGSAGLDVLFFQIEKVDQLY